MCFNFVFNSPFSIVFKLDILSVNIVIGLLKLNSSDNILRIHSTFFTHSDVAIYSASVVLVATMDCFLDPQLIGELPNKIRCPEVLFRSSVSPAKSESVYALIGPISPIFNL